MVPIKWAGVAQSV